MKEFVEVRFQDGRVGLESRYPDFLAELGVREYASDGELAGLERRASEVIDFLVSTGTPLPAEQMEDLAFTNDEVAKSRIRDDGHFSMGASKEPYKGENPERLSIYYSEGNIEAQMVLYFNGNYMIEIKMRGELATEEYGTGDMPLSLMKRDELGIINHYLDKYTKEVIAPALQE